MTTRFISIVAVAAALAACGTSAPPPRLYRLPLEAPGGARPAAAVADVWEMFENVRVPGYLDRETIVVADEGGEVGRIDGVRWAEPLRDAVPRLLLDDLVALRGPGSTWRAPAPAGVVAVRRLRVELLALHATAGRGEVRVAARWTIEDASGTAAPQAGRIDARVPVQGAGVDAIAVAHRAAVRRLAEAIATASGSGSG